MLQQSIYSAKSLVRGNLYISLSVHIHFMPFPLTARASAGKVRDQTSLLTLQGRK
jgi:hypothetical protein